MMAYFDEQKYNRDTVASLKFLDYVYRAFDTGNDVLAELLRQCRRNADMGLNDLSPVTEYFQDRYFERHSTFIRESLATDVERLEYFTGHYTSRRGRYLWQFIAVRLFEVVFARYRRSLPARTPLLGIETYNRMNRDGLIGCDEGNDYSNASFSPQYCQDRFIDYLNKKCPFVSDLIGELVAEAQKAPIDGEVLATILSELGHVYCNAEFRALGHGMHLLERCYQDLPIVPRAERSTVEDLLFATMRARFNSDDEFIRHVQALQPTDVSDHTLALCKDARFLIVQMLSDVDVVSLSRTCKSWSQVLRADFDKYWKRSYEVRYFSNPPPVLPVAPVMWRHYVRYQEYINFDDCDEYDLPSLRQFLVSKYKLGGYPCSVKFAKCKTDEESQLKWNALYDKPQAPAP